MTSEFSAIKPSIVIVVSEFNAKIIEHLLQGALDAFTYHGGNKSDIIITNYFFILIIYIIFQIIYIYILY